MAFLRQALRLGDLLSPHSAFQGHAAHTTGWSAMLSPNGSSDTCISDGVFHIPMPCFHGAPRPAHTARRARAAPRETACAGPAHHHPSPSRAAPDPATHRASPNTAPGVSDSARQAAYGIPGVFARLVSTPEAGTNGS